jgi:hypothetical protein
MPTQQYRTKDGKRVKGVTTLLNVLAKPALIYWAFLQGLENFNRVTEGIMHIVSDAEENYAEYGTEDTASISEIRQFIQHFEIGALYDKRDKAATAGTLGHLFVENHLKKLPDPSTAGLPEPIVKKAEGSYLAYLEWERSHKFQMVHSELSLVSEVYGFGGTIDIGAVVGEMGIVDIKTSKGIYFTMIVQVAAYGQLYNEHHPDAPIKGYHILRLGEEGDFDHKYWPNLDDYWEVFKLCLGIQNILDKTGDRKSVV